MDVEDLVASMHVGKEGYELMALKVSSRPSLRSSLYMTTDMYIRGRLQSHLSKTLGYPVEPATTYQPVQGVNYIPPPPYHRGIRWPRHRIAAAIITITNIRILISAILKTEFIIDHNAHRRIVLKGFTQSHRTDSIGIHPWISKMTTPVIHDSPHLHLLHHRHGGSPIHSHQQHP